MKSQYRVSLVVSRKGDRSLTRSRVIFFCLIIEDYSRTYTENLNVHSQGVGSREWGVGKSGNEFNKSKWNTHLQPAYQISKRQANGVISYSKGLVESKRKCQINHIKTLTGISKSLEKSLKRIEQKLSSGRKFYAKKNWLQAKLLP